MIPPHIRRTRGKTRPGRLRRLDALLCAYARDLLLRRDGPWAHALYVDVGYGEEPTTTLESVQALRSVRPDLHALGVESDAHRVQRAQQWQLVGVRFRHGGFALPLHPGEHAGLVRAMNVLRQYRESEVADAHRAMGEALLPGGLLVEGTSCKQGSLWTAHLLRRHAAGLRREALVLSTDCSRGFAPIQLRDYLPRDLRRRVVPGEAIHAFFAAWTRAWEAARAAGAREPRAAFTASVLRLAESVPGVVVDRALVEEGNLVWRPPEGVPTAGGTEPTG